MRSSNYFMSDVSAVVPLGAAVCTHDESDPKATLNVMERQSIFHRNRRLFHLPQQGDGGTGPTLSSRPKSSIILVEHGARFSEASYCDKRRISDLKGRRASGGHARRAVAAKASGGGERRLRRQLC